MTDEPKKKKNSEEKVEWSFDFGKLGESINEMMGSLADDQETQHASLTAPLDGATRATINIHFAMGENTITALEGGDTLMQADIDYVGEIVFTTEGDEEKTVILKQKQQRDPGSSIKQGFRMMADRKKLFWNIGLAKDIPLTLKVDGGVGPVEMDLSGLTLESLEVDSGVGTLNLILPVQESRYEVDVDSGVGAVRLTIPDNTDAVIDVNGGVGSVDVFVAPDQPVRLKGSTGLGGINVPQHFSRRKGKQEFMDNSGTWETDGYEVAARSVKIKYDGGVGSLRVRPLETV